MHLRTEGGLVRGIALSGVAVLIGLIAGCGSAVQPPEHPLDGDSLALAWNYQTDGPINRPPQRVGDLLVFAPEDDGLFALDVQTGGLAWHFEPPAGMGSRAFAVGDQLVFAGVDEGRILALDAESGEVRWERELGIHIRSAPLWDGDVLYVPTTFVGSGLEPDPHGRAKLFALSVRDGRELWSIETDNYILQTPERHGDTLYVGGNFYDPREVDEGGHMRLYALSAADGSVRWTYESEDGYPKRLYATDTALVFIGYQDFANGLDTATGRLLWRRDTGNWVPSLTGHGDVVYFGSANTIVHALNVDSGDVVWEHNIAEGTFNYVLDAPVRIDDDLYFLTQHGDIVALNALDGSLRWTLPTEIEARVGLSVSGGWLFIGDAHGQVYAYTSRPSP